MEAHELTEEEVEAFLVALRSADIDKKVNLLQLWGIKLEKATELPERTVDAITLVITPCARSSSHLLVTSTLSSFAPYFLPLVPTSSSQSHLRLAVSQLLPALIEKLNDAKDKIHEPARVCVALLGHKCYAADRADPSFLSASKGKEKAGIASSWEAMVKDVLAGRGVRGKLEALKMLLSMRGDTANPLPLKPWLPSLVNLLEDSDGSVRDQARETVVTLLSPPSTPPAARSELKKLMLQRNVRKSIADAIIARVLGTATASSLPTVDTTASPSKDAARSAAATPVADDVPLAYIASARDLDAEFKAMLPHFAGKETEHNWGPRERSLVRVRGMLRANVFRQYPDAFVGGLRGGVMDGVDKTLLSLRTTLAQHACATVQELAEHLGSSFDVLAESTLPTLGKMAGFTKRIIAEKSQRAVTAIVQNTTVSPRILITHILAAMQEKNVQSRQYGAAHLKTFLDAASKNSSNVEAIHGAADQLEQALKKALGDVNPQAREKAREAYWSFDKIWPSRAQAILSGLEGTARKQLEKANPCSISTTSTLDPATPSKPRPSSAMAAILAAKRAKAAQIAAERAADEVITKSPLGQPEPQESAQEPSVVAARDSEVRLPSPPATSQESDVSQLDETATGHDSQLRVAGNGSADIHPAAAPNDASPFATPRSPDAVRNASSEKSPSRSPLGSSVPRPITRPSLPTTTIPGATPIASSGSPSISRTLSRSPPSVTESRHQQFRSPVQPSMASSDASGAASSLRTPVQPGFTIGNRSRQSEALVSPLPATVNAFSPTTASPTNSSRSSTNNHLFSRPPIDAADEARRAQVAQGLSAAQQLLDFDDDQYPVAAQQPLTPARVARPHLSTPLQPFRTPRNGSGKFRHVWEDSPKALTPKLLKSIENRGSERSWWIQHRTTLEETRLYTAESLIDASSIEDEIDLLAMGTPTQSSLRKLMAFSAHHKIALSGPTGEDDSSALRRIWDEGRLFDRIFQALLSYVQPSQTPTLLKEAVVLLWELIKNQWVMFETQEDALLDALFRLRSSTNTAILESTNSLVALLSEVCDPPFLLSLLHSALDRYLEGPQNEGEFVERDGKDVYRNSTHIAGYAFGLNAMGLCIIHLPKEAVEVEAKRLERVVMAALALDYSDSISARQAAHRVILAVQCILGDDVRTLSLFPRLNSGQRSFATYLMQENGVMSKAPADAEEDALRRESVMEQLLEGLAKGAKVRK